MLTADTINRIYDVLDELNISDITAYKIVKNIIYILSSENKNEVNINV